MKTVIRVRRETFLFLSILALLGLVAVLLFSLIGGELRTSRLLAEYQAERTAFALFEAWREGDAELAARWRGEDSVLGFGVYEPSGRPLTRFGTAPEVLDPAALPAGVPAFIRAESTERLILVRPVGGMPESMPPGGPGPRQDMRRMMGRFGRFGQLIWLETDAGGLLAGRGPLRAARVLFPLALAAVVGFFVYLYRKNIGYQKRFESHQRLIRLGEAARTLAHEIRNPLGAMRIQTAYLRRTLPAGRREELGVIEEEIGRLDLLVNRISDFLRDPRGQPEPLDLEAFIHRQLARTEGDVRFENPGDAPARVAFDRERLRSVLENLIANARESTEESAPGRNRVEVRLQRSKGRVVLSVLDRGRGLPPGKGEEIFDPFFTTKTRGSGIGLSLSRRFVEEAGGRLELLPREGGGTEARVTFKETP